MIYINEIEKINMMKDLKHFLKFQISNISVYQQYFNLSCRIFIFIIF